MEDEEFEKAKRFLDEKKLPTSEDILNLFFKGVEDVNVISEAEFKAIDFAELGEADDIKTISGTEWIASRLMWDTPDGSICSVNLIKNQRNNLKDPFKLFNLKDPSEIVNGLYSNRKNYPYGTENIIDIEYDDVLPLPFDEQLSLAIEVEDFEEAARLRDWDTGLKNLLLSLKPKILDALKKEKVNLLEDYLKEISDYRKTL